MPRLTILISITLLLLALTANAQLILQTPEQLARMQETLKADPSFPQFEMTGPSDGGPATGGPKLTECLTVERKLSLFYEYLREVTPVMKRIMSETKQTTLLVPVNQAIIALPHKPHQDAEDSIEITDFQARSNADRFVMAHTLPTSIPWPVDSSSPATYANMLDTKITFRREGDEVRVDPGNVKVLAMKEASNGRIIYLDGTLKY